MDIYENGGKSYSYEEAKKRAKEFYCTIGPVWCPALNEGVLLNQKGFKHLIGSRGVVRPQNEQIRRFDLLRYVKIILENPQAIIFHDTKGLENSWTDFWIFTEIIDNVRIKIVVRQIGKGKKHFFSIYGKTQKSTH
jgi:hypothetical protein